MMLLKLPDFRGPTIHEDSSQSR